MRELNTTTAVTHTLLVSHCGKPATPNKQVGPGGVSTAKAANVSADPTALRTDCSVLLRAQGRTREASACKLVWALWAALIRGGEALCTSERRPLLPPRALVGDALCSCLLPAEALLEVRDLTGDALSSASGVFLGVLFLLGDWGGGGAAGCAAAAIRLGACWRSTTARIAHRMAKMEVNTAKAIRCTDGKDKRHMICRQLLATRPYNTSTLPQMLHVHAHSRWGGVLTRPTCGQRLDFLLNSFESTAAQRSTRNCTGAQAHLRLRAVAVRGYLRSDEVEARHCCSREDPCDLIHGILEAPKCRAAHASHRSEGTVCPCSLSNVMLIRRFRRVVGDSFLTYCCNTRFQAA